jgi:endonuclease-3 related protein
MPTSIAKAPTPKWSVHSLYKRLYEYYGSQQWWPASTSWEMMVGAILTQNTAWTNVKMALRALKEANQLTASATARMPRKRLEALIRSSGTFRQKAKRLQLFARALLEDRSLITDRVRLLALNGVGPETADSILLYASRQPIFVVDAYTRRLGHRLGWFRTDDYHKVQAYFHERLPRDVSLYNEYHALIIRLVKEVCLKRHPLCLECPVQSKCAFGRKRKPR